MDIHKIVRSLPHYFEGTGEVKSFLFNIADKNDFAYMYEVNDGCRTYFEVFERKHTPICLDFNKRIYSDKEFKDIYPKAKDFGIWAWSFNDKEIAVNKFKSIKTNKNVNRKEK